MADGGRVLVEGVAGEEEEDVTATGSSSAADVGATVEGGGIGVLVAGMTAVVVLAGAARLASAVRVVEAAGQSQ